jgi:hypothetical protein
MTITMKKTIKGVENIIGDRLGVNTVAFLADLPVNAIVDGIKVNGVWVSDMILDPNPMLVTYPRTAAEDGKRIAAFIRYFYDGGALYNEAMAYMIEEFEVYYHEEAVVIAD